MGKLKGFGKKKTAETPVSPVVEAPAPPPEDTVSAILAIDMFPLHADRWLTCRDPSLPNVKRNNSTFSISSEHTHSILPHLGKLHLWIFHQTLHSSFPKRQKMQVHGW
jgi:hypothetical protein